jgi:hypothetical protein
MHCNCSVLTQPKIQAVSELVRLRLATADKGRAALKSIIVNSECPNVSMSKCLNVQMSPTILLEIHHTNH